MVKATAGSPTGRYDANYGNFQTELYAQIRREAFGEDIGQNSWLTSDEHNKFLEWLDLASGKILLDVGCGAGGPALRIAAITGCSVVGVDVHEHAVATAVSLAAQRGFAERTKFHVANARIESCGPAVKTNWLLPGLSFIFAGRRPYWTL